MRRQRRGVEVVLLVFLIIIALFFSVLNFFEHNSVRGSPGGTCQNCSIFTAYSSTQVVLNTTKTSIALYGNNGTGQGYLYVITTLPSDALLFDNANGIAILNAQLPYVLSAHHNVVDVLPILPLSYDDYYTSHDMNFRFQIKNSTDVSEVGTIHLLPTYTNDSNSFRYAIPAITPQWWENQWTPNESEQITKEDYKNYIIARYNILSFDIRQRCVNDVNCSAADNYALYEAFMYNITGDADHLNWSLRLLNVSYTRYKYGSFQYPNAKISFYEYQQAVSVFLMIKNSSDLTQQNKDFLRDYMLLLDYRFSHDGTAEYGINNRAFAGGMSRAIVGHNYPTLPSPSEASSRNFYTTLMWNDFWPLGETSENSDGYNSAWLEYLTRWIEGTDQQQLYQDPRIQRLSEKYLNQLEPLGTMTPYGDDVGFNEGGEAWIVLYERMASAYHDGRYKTAAHRLYSYSLLWTPTREAEMAQWGNINSDFSYYLIQAYMAADDSIPEAPLTSHSELSEKKEYLYNGFAEYVVNRTIPDKLILRSGTGTHDMSAVVNLVPLAGHSHCDLGSVTFFSYNGSVLLESTPYELKQQDYQNMFQVVQGNEVRCDLYGGIFFNKTVYVDSFSATPAGTFASFTIPHYINSNLNLTRRIFFVNNSFMWVSDAIVADGPVTADVGPAWNTLSVYGSEGNNFITTAFQIVPVVFIFDPLYLMQWENVHSDLTILFPSASSYVIDPVIWDTSHYQNSKSLLNSVRYRIWQKQHITYSQGDSAVFESVLLPHSANPNSVSYTQSVQTISSTTNDSAISYTRDGVVTYLGINSNGAVRQLPFGSTNAEAYLLSFRSGVLQSYWIVNGTTLNVGTHSIISGSAMRTEYKVCSNGCVSQIIDPVDPHNGGGSGSSGGGGGASEPVPAPIGISENATLTCQEVWACDAWTNCSEGIRTRVCNDMNLCGTIENKPDSTQSCDANATTQSNYGTLRESLSQSTGIVIAGIIGGFVILGIILFFIRVQRMKSSLVREKIMDLALEARKKTSISVHEASIAYLRAKSVYETLYPKMNADDKAYCRDELLSVYAAIVAQREALKLDDPEPSEETQAE